MSKCEVLQNNHKMEVTNSKGLVAIVLNDLQSVASFHQASTEARTSSSKCVRVTKSTLAMSLSGP